MFLRIWTEKSTENYSEGIGRLKEADAVVIGVGFGLFLELGVGANTSAGIKYPFWEMTARNPKAVYACINYEEALCPQEIAKQSVYSPPKPS